MIFSILLLIVPLAWELYNDKDGEQLSDKGLDVLLRVCFALAAAIIGYMLVDKPIIDGFILAMAIHFFAFDYAIVWLLKKRGVIEGDVNLFEHLGKSYTDDVLRQFTPLWRFVIKFAFLVGTVVIYIL